MSDFEEEMAAAFAEAAETIGAVSFTIAGVGTGAPLVLTTFAGVIDRHTSGQALHDDGGGMLADLAASIVAKKSQFAARPKLNAQLTVEGVAYEIADLEDDAISYTFRLRNPVN